MMRSSIIAVLLILALPLFGQDISRSVVSNGGGDLGNSSVGHVSWTLGEIVTEYLENDIILSQGFQQGYLEEITSNEAHLPSIEVSVFPNPMIDHVNVRLNGHDQANYHLFDQNGRQVDHAVIRASTSRINLEALPTGTYALVLQCDGYRTHIEKLVKINK